MTAVASPSPTLSPAPADSTASAVPALLTEREVASAMKLSTAMLQKMRREGTGPAFVRIGSSIRYPVSALAAWVTSRQTLD